MRVVWKRALTFGFSDYDLPKDAQIVHAAFQRDEPCIWFVCNPANRGVRGETRRLLLLATGQTYEPTHDTVWTHLGTLLTADTWFVYHLFEVTQS